MSKYPAIKDIHPSSAWYDTIKLLKGRKVKQIETLVEKPNIGKDYYYAFIELFPAKRSYVSGRMVIRGVKFDSSKKAKALFNEFKRKEEESGRSN